MATMAMPINGMAPWCVDYHRTMAAAIVACKAAKNSAAWIILAKDFWQVSRDFKALLSELDRVTQLPPAELQIAVDKLSELYKTANRTIDVAYKHKLHNRTLTGASVRSLANCNARLLDVIERFQLSLDPATSEAARRAIEEYERGETVSLESLV
jgi:hypothetical protein